MIEVVMINDTEVNEKLIAHIQSRLATPVNPLTAIDVAASYLFSRILEFTQAAHALVSDNWAAPVAIIVLARAQFESCIALHYMLGSDSEAEREMRSENFVAFAEYDHIKSIGPDLAAHRSGLTPEEQVHFDRRVQIAAKVESNLDANQRKQRYSTWNGLSIRATIDAVGHSNAKEWYGLMSQISHASLSMFHKSVSISAERIDFCQPDGGQKDARDWIAKMNHMAFIAFLRFDGRHGQGRILDGDRVIAAELGILNLPASS